MLAALLTPPGRGALAVLHVCGEGSASLVGGLFGRPIADRPRYGRLRLDGEVLDEVMVRLAPGFTGEETVEISCHGGPAPVGRILAALEARGARRMDAAGLLERGVATGHLDRIRAEAWTLLPRAATELAARVLHDQTEGALSRAVAAMASPADAARLLGTAPLGLALASPRRVALVGSPNAGKSTLFNALVESDRVIVSPVPGTTRDPVRELVAVDQVPFELVDTAGIEAPRDLLERLSIERTEKVVQQADAVVFLFDAIEGPRPEEIRFLEAGGHPRVIAVVNKVDAGNRRPPVDALPISAKKREGLDVLRRAILDVLGIVPRYEAGTAVVFTERQRRLLTAAAESREGLDPLKEDLLRGRP